MSWAKWLGIPDSAAVENLLTTLSWCNQQSTLHNNNASSAALMNAGHCDATLEHAVASALLTLGVKHGPAASARWLLYKTKNEAIVEKLESDEMLPGWGNSFHKKSIDPAFVPIDHLLRDEYHSHSDRLAEISTLIFKVKGKTLYPNPASYNAVCAEIVGLVPGTEIILFIAGRLPAWGRQYVGVRA